MCLIAFSVNPNENTALILVGNRDEYHARPTAPLAWWPEEPILAGRDLEAGGTWCAVDKHGRFGALTNLRGVPAPERPPSRGHLIPAFLRSQRSAGAFLRDLQSDGHRYAGFNLLLGDSTGVWLYSNGTDAGVKRVDTGCHALSNGPFGAPWQKSVRAQDALASHVRTGLHHDQLREILADRTLAPDHLLPNTGLPKEIERRLSPAFIVGTDYGTRSTTVCVLQKTGLWIEETTYDPEGRASGTQRLHVTVSSAQA